MKQFLLLNNKRYRNRKQKTMQKKFFIWKWRLYTFASAIIKYCKTFYLLENFTCCYPIFANFWKNLETLLIFRFFYFFYFFITWTWIKGNFFTIFREDTCFWVKRVLLQKLCCTVYTKSRYKNEDYILLLLPL